MDQAVIISEIKENRTHIVSIIERLARLEERTKLRSTLFGAIGGSLPVAGAILLWWLGRL